MSTWRYTPPWIREAMDKYRRKTDHVRLRPLLRRAQAMTNYRRAAAQGKLELITLKVKGILDEHGVYSDLHPSYLAYVLALDKSQHDMRYMVDLRREHRILRNRWELRGLEAQVLHLLDQVFIYRTRDY